MNAEERGLAPIREEIDRIDGEILRLFVRRMDCAREVARIKKESGQPIFRPEREREILERAEREGGEYGAAARSFFSGLMELSRTLQREEREGGQPLRRQLEEAPRALSLLPGEAVACQGMTGSFSEEAARIRFGDRPRRFFPQFADVFDALAREECPVGVLPAENSSAGPVEEVYELLRENRLFIIGTVEVPVSHCLCGKKGVTVGEIRTVYSHPQALAQCSAWLRAQGKEGKDYSNTAAAARMVAEQGDISHAVICSRQAAKEYDLEILSENIQNEQNNRTRFIVVSKRLILPEGADRISICLTLPHVSGSLCRILQRFALHGHNLTRIQSVPIPGSPFDYRFFVDFTGDLHAPGTVSLLCSLSEELPGFSLLGVGESAEE